MGQNVRPRLEGFIRKAQLPPTLYPQHSGNSRMEGRMLNQTCFTCGGRGHIEETA